jgi:hypothetical protein
VVEEPLPALRGRGVMAKFVCGNCGNEVDASKVDRVVDGATGPVRIPGYALCCCGWEMRRVEEDE